MEEIRVWEHIENICFSYIIEGNTLAQLQQLTSKYNENVYRLFSK